MAEAVPNPADGLNPLSEAERRRIEGWQRGPRLSPTDLGVHHCFERQAARTPEAIALIFQERALSYSDLNSRANRLARRLVALGLRPGGIVAVALERSVDLIVALLAILKAGGAYLALDPTWPPRRRSQLVRETGCVLLLAPEGPVVLEGPSLSRSAAFDPPLAYVATTSGSTGTPKGVAVGHAGILRLVDPANGFLLAAGAKVLQFAPVAFDAATFEIWGPLLNGGTLVIAPPGPLSLSDLARELRLHGITTLWLTAGLFHAMVSSELTALAGVRQVLAGGDVLAVAAVRRLLAAFPPGHGLINGYGPTEATTFTCCHRLAAGEAVADAGVPIGRPIANTTVRVLDPAGQLCPIGVIGELHIGGAGLALGYLHNPERTAEAFIADRFSRDPAARLYKTGDRVSWTADGTLAFHGRLDQQIKLRGFRIEPAEIEAALLHHPAMAQAVVVLRSEDPAHPRLVAYWVPRAGARSRNSGASASAEQLRGFLAERLPAVMVPEAFVELEALPLTSNGKLDRQALPAPPPASPPNARVEPATERERQLWGLWSKVLGHGEFGCADTFCLVGGHSLAAMRLAEEVESLWGQRLSVAEIFRHPTIRELAAWLAQRQPVPASANLVILQPAGQRLPLHVIHGWGGMIGGFIHLARALAPERPVLGLQNSPDAAWCPQVSVADLAARYAEQILSRHGCGPIHLLGYSAGGWYAYAVAAALLERGVRIGLLAVLDTEATARIHRRLGVVLLAQKLLPRVRDHGRALLAMPAGQGRRGFLQERVRALRHQVKGHLGVFGPAAAPRLEIDGIPLPAFAGGDPFVRLLEEGYQPPRLPLRVDLFTPPAQIPVQRRLWRFYARAGVRLHPLFKDHFDFLQPERMPELAAALEGALADIEETP